MKGTRRVKTFYPTMSPSPLAMTQGITFGEARMVYHPGRGGAGGYCSEAAFEMASSMFPTR